MTDRHRRSGRRECDVISFAHDGIGYVGKVPRFKDGSIAETFLSPSVKSGTALSHMAQALAVTASIALQHGAPVEEIAHALPKMDGGEPGDPLGQLLDLVEKEAVLSGNEDDVRLDDGRICPSCGELTIDLECEWCREDASETARRQDRQADLVADEKLAGSFVDDPPYLPDDEPDPGQRLAELLGSCQLSLFEDEDA